jgi:hypothetical protein
MVSEYIGNATQWYGPSVSAAGGNMLHFTSLVRSVTAHDIGTLTCQCCVVV